MDRLLRYRDYIILSLLWAVFFGGYVLYDHWPRPEPIEIIEPTALPAPTDAPIQVHVAGAVRRPGVYALPPGSRLLQAVEAAGGLTEEADPNQANLAERLADGQQVYIPGRGTPALPHPTPLAQPARAADVPLAGGAVNINTASAAELDALPGIGPTLAERIIAYRRDHGPFSEPSQIMEVQGIGQGVYEGISKLITVH
jgi:competence protein ComEA